MTFCAWALMKNKTKKKVVNSQLLCFCMGNAECRLFECQVEVVYVTACPPHVH